MGPWERITESRCLYLAHTFFYGLLSQVENAMQKWLYLDSGSRFVSQSTDQHLGFLALPCGCTPLVPPQLEPRPDSMAQSQTKETQMEAMAMAGDLALACQPGQDMGTLSQAYGQGDADVNVLSP